MSRLPRLVAVLLAISLLPACSSLIGGPKETPKLYAPVLHPQANAAWPQVVWSLATSRSGRWVVARATRTTSLASIITTSRPAWPASSSVVPV